MVRVYQTRFCQHMWFYHIKGPCQALQTACA